LIQFLTVQQAIKFATTVASRDIVQISSLRQLMGGGARATSGDSPQDLHAEAALILDILEGGMSEDELVVLAMLYAPPRAAPQRTALEFRRQRRIKPGPLSEDYERVLDKVATYLSLEEEGAMFTTPAARLVLDSWLLVRQRRKPKGSRALRKALKVAELEARRRRKHGWETLRRWQYQAFAKAQTLLVESGHVAGTDWRDHVDIT